MSTVMVLDREAVEAAVSAVPDPELPMLSIGDLGMVHEVTVEPDRIRVLLLPTFIGCPALERIAADVREQLAGTRRPVEVATTFVVPWTSERITAQGRAALRAAGIAPPAAPGDLRCPHCDSADVGMDNLFGPTQCRSVHYCRACRQPFEALKTL